LPDRVLSPARCGHEYAQQRQKTDKRAHYIVLL
jgi:hypothetical protein